MFFLVVIPVTAISDGRSYINRVARTSLVTPWLTKLGDEVVDGSQAGDGLIFCRGDAGPRGSAALARML